MKSNNTQNSNSNFLENSNFSDISKKHKDMLGFEVPENYFENSTQDILQKVKTADKKVIQFKPLHIAAIAIAASVVLLVSVSIFNNGILPFNSVPEYVIDSLKINVGSENLANNEIDYTDDIAFTSLFVDDDEIDQHVEEYMFKDIIDENSH